MIIIDVREPFEYNTGHVDGALNIPPFYQGFDYNHHGAKHVLYIYELSIHPKIVLSAEHASYDWVSRDVFLEKAKGAKDDYMHMVYSELI